MNKSFEKDLVVASEDDRDIVPLFCPVCYVSMSDYEDFKAYKMWSSCMTCAEKWAWPNKEKWKKGWRPQIDEE